jgi:hypothetical protein
VVNGEFLGEDVAANEVGLLTTVTVGSSSNTALRDEGKAANPSPGLDGNVGEWRWPVMGNRVAGGGE